MTQRARAVFHQCPNTVHAMPPILVNGEAQLPAPWAWACGEGTFLRGVVDNCNPAALPMRVNLPHSAEHYLDFVATGDVPALREATNVRGTQDNYYRHGDAGYAYSPAMTTLAMDCARTLREQLVVADYVLDDDYKRAVRDCAPAPAAYVDVFFALLMDLELRAHGAEHVRDNVVSVEDTLRGKHHGPTCEYVGKMFLDNREAIVERYGAELANARMYALYLAITRCCRGT